MDSWCAKSHDINYVLLRVETKIITNYNKIYCTNFSLNP